MLTTLDPRAGESAGTTEFTGERNRHGPTPDRESAWRPNRVRDGSTASPGNRFAVLHEIFEARADARPDATAVVFGDKQISYGRLERRANRLARYLCAHGVQRGSFVAVHLPRGFHAYTALLRILQAGDAYASD